MVAIINTTVPALGAPSPPHKTGRYYPSHMLVSEANAALTTTVNRLYYMPYLVTEIRAYTGFVMKNTGTLDSGEKCRMGLYLDSNGNPGTLVQAATEVTFGGAAADNTTANSFTPSVLGWHWICAHFNSASDVRGMFCVGYDVTTAANKYDYLPVVSNFGTFAVDDSNKNSSTAPAAYYVDTAYGALASTAVAPTATIATAPYVGLIA